MERSHPVAAATDIPEGTEYNPKLDRYQAHNFLGTDQFDPVEMATGSPYLVSLKNKNLTIVCECGTRFHSRGDTPCLSRNRNQVSRCTFPCSIGQSRSLTSISRSGGDQDAAGIRAGMIDLFWTLIDSVAQLEPEAFLSWERFWQTLSLSMQKLSFRPSFQTLASPTLLDLSWIPTGGHRGGLSSLNARLRELQATTDQVVEGYVFGVTRYVDNQGVLVHVSNPDAQIQYKPIPLRLDHFPYKFGSGSSTPPYLWLARCHPSDKTYPVFRESVLYPIISLISPLPVFDDIERHIGRQMLEKNFFPTKPSVRDYTHQRPYLVIASKRQVYSSSHQVLASLGKLNAFRNWGFFRISD
jgi:hypothetical protein